MTDLIDELRKQMRERLNEIDRELRSVDGLIEEKARIERALSSEPFAQPTRKGSTNGGSPRRVRRRAGDTRERFLAFVSERPGVSVAEVAAGVGIDKGYAHNLTSRLTKAGVLERTELPGGGKGLRRKTDAEHPAPEPPKRTRRPRAAAPATEESSESFAEAGRESDPAPKEGQGP